MTTGEHVVLAPVPRGDGGASSHEPDHAQPRPDHLVSFYEHTAYLAASVAPFLLEGLRRGEIILIVATPAHREAFASALTDRGHDLGHSRGTGRYLELDAATTLARLATDGELSPARFEQIVARPIATMAAPGGLRVYGEMVALLWRQGHLALALELEDRWNGLQDQVPFPLFCGYPLSAFDTPQTTERFHDVCARHTKVTTDSYGALDEVASVPGGVVMLGARQPGGCPG